MLCFDDCGLFLDSCPTFLYVLIDLRGTYLFCLAHPQSLQFAVWELRGGLPPWSRIGLLAPFDEGDLCSVERDRRGAVDMIQDMLTLCHMAYQTAL
jgi:hypothetical protein